MSMSSMPACLIQRLYSVYVPLIAHILEAMHLRAIRAICLFRARWQGCKRIPGDGCPEQRLIWRHVRRFSLEH